MGKNKKSKGSFPRPKPIIEVKNYGGGTHVEILGIDVSRGFVRADYKGRKAAARRNKTRVLIEVEIDTLLEDLANLSDEQIAKAWRRLEPHLRCRKHNK